MNFNNGLIVVLAAICLIFMSLTAVSAEELIYNSNDDTLVNNLNDKLGSEYTNLNGNMEGVGYATENLVPVNSTEIYVSVDGMGNGSSNNPTNWTSAIDNIGDNGTIYFNDGEYKFANQVISKNLTLSALENTSPIINGEKLGNIFVVKTGNSLTVNSLTFINGEGKVGLASNGGAIEVSDNANLNVICCTFKDNTGTIGGAVHISNKGTGSFVNSTFIRNTGKTAGGAIGSVGRIITIDNCVFENNRAITRNTGNGGAIYLSSFSKALISNCNLTGNNGSKSGAIYLSSALGSNNASITNSNFVNNKATYNQGSASYGYGGGIYGTSETKLNIMGCSFVNNTNPKGNSNDLYIDYNCIANCDYNWWGSNLAPVSNVNYNFKGDVTLNYWLIASNNTDNGQVSININKFTDKEGNIGNIEGILVKRQVFFNSTEMIPNSTVTGMISMFNGIEAKNITAVVDNQILNLKITPYVEPKFEGKEVYVDGSVSESGNGSLLNPFKTILEAVDLANTADHLVTIYILAGTYEDINMTVTNNLTISSYNGAKVVLDANNKGYFFNSNNSSNTLTVNNLIFNNATGFYGGGFSKTMGGAINSEGYLNVYNCEFNNNRAGSNGGTILSRNGATLINSTISNGVADYNGGAICVYENLSVVNCTFINNHAQYRGGAIKSFGNASIINSTFMDNIVKRKGEAGYGGAISVTLGNLYIDNSIFLNNTAYYGGGAIYLGDGDEYGVSKYLFTVKNSIFDSNLAPFGGAIGTSDRGINMTGSKVCNNAVPQDSVMSRYGTGTGIYIKQGNSLVNGSIFADNVNLGNGKDIYIGNGNIIANYNWWGTNAKVAIPKNVQVKSGTLTLDNWVIMNTTYEIKDNDIEITSNFNNCIDDEGTYIKSPVKLMDIDVAFDNGVESRVIKSKDGIASTVFDLTTSGSVFTITANNEVQKINISTKQDSIINITVNDVIVGNDVVVKVDITSGATGNVTFTVGDVSKNVTIVDAMASATFKDLGIGAYNVTVVYSGDNNYRPALNSSSFNVVLPDVVIGSVSTQWSSGIYAGVDNIFTININNKEHVNLGGVIVELYSNETNKLIASYAIDNLVSGNNKITLVDPTIRPIDENTVWPNASSNKINFIVKLKYKEFDLNNKTITKILAYNGYLNKTYAYNGSGNIINRNYTISGDVIISSQPASQYMSQFSKFRNETWNIMIPEDSNVVKAILYFNYNWDTSLFPNGWNLTFNGHDITNKYINHEIDQGNLGGYGAYRYGSLVFDVTDYYNSNGNNSFVINKTVNCALYPSTLAVLYNITGSESIKDVYFSDCCDIFYPYYNQYGYDDKLSSLFTFNNLNINGVINATWYAFAGSGNNGDGNLTFNGVEYVNVWDGGSQESCNAFIVDVTNIIKENNTAYFLTSSDSKVQTTVVAYEQILVVERQKRNSTIIIDVNDVKIGEDVVVNASVTSGATGNFTFTIGNKTQTVAISDGKASAIFKGLASGNYTVKVEYSGDDNYNANQSTANFMVSKISDYNMDISVPEIKEGVNSTIGVDLPKDATGTVTVEIDSKKYTANVIDGTANVIVSGLSAGDYNITTVYSGDAKYDSMTKKGNITVIPNVNVNLDVSDVEMFYHDGTRLIAKLTDFQGKPIVNATIYFSINGVTYAKTTDANGTASIGLNLDSNIYQATIYYNGSANYSKISKNITVAINSSIIADDLVKMYQNATRFYAKFLGSDGKVLANTQVKFNINGVFYTRSTDKYGVTSLAINLRPGNYILTAYNPVTGEQQGFNITVKSLIVQNDLTKYYMNASKFQATIYDKNGSLAVNKNVTFNINGVFYTRTTDSNGVVSLNINLRPGEYIVTTIYDGLDIGNNIFVLPTLVTHDLNMAYGDGSKFTAQTLDGQGKPLANQNVSFNINGIFYNEITGDNGIASLNINLMSGKYIITSYWNDFQTGNNIKISP